MKRKVCTDCGELKLTRDFYKDKHKISGYKSYCKKCAIKRAVEILNKMLSYLSIHSS